MIFFHPPLPQKTLLAILKTHSYFSVQNIGAQELQKPSHYVLKTVLDITDILPIILWESYYVCIIKKKQRLNE